MVQVESGYEIIAIIFSRDTLSNYSKEE